MQSELKQREEIIPLLNRLEEFEVRKGTKKLIHWNLWKEMAYG